MEGYKSEGYCIYCDDKLSQKDLSEILSPRMKFGYEYDFGSTTYLELRFIGIYNIKADKNILLLSRNEPLKIKCNICGKKPAVLICPNCVYEGNGFLCQECSEKHAEICEDYDEEYLLPVVNSPRMGVCGYTGGSIDLERDGVYK